MAQSPTLIRRGEEWWLHLPFVQHVPFPFSTKMVPDGSCRAGTGNFPARNHRQAA